MWASASFQPSTAIDHNFLIHDDTSPKKRQQEEEDLDTLLALLSPVNQAKQRVIGSLTTEEIQAETSVGKVTHQVAYYSRQCKDYLKEFSGTYPRLSKIGLKTFEVGGIALEGVLIIGACSGPQSIFLCLGSVGFVASNHSGLTTQAFKQLNRGVAWGLEQGGSSLMDAQEVAPLISGGMLMLAGGKAVKVISPSLGKTLFFKDPSSFLSLEVGSLFPYQAKAYLREIEQITGRTFQPEQRALLKQSLQEKPYIKLGETDYKKHQYAFKNKKDNLILKWENKTGQTWPTYKTDVFGKEGKIIKRAGRKYDAHEIIPNEYGGPLTWYNIHPARFPDQHQAGIHGKNSVLNKLLIQLESK